VPYWTSKDVGYTGPSFPFRFGSDGAVAMSSADPTTGDSTHIREALAQLFLTKRGERFFNRGFGAAPTHLLFELNDELTFYIWASEVVDLLRIWEPRVMLQDMRILGRDPDQGIAAIAVKFWMWRSQTSEWVTLFVRG